MTKRVRWSTVTIHEFGVGHGGSAVPQTGPSIGLARKPEFTWSTRIGAMARECDGVRRFTSQERIALLRNAGFSRDSVDGFVAEAKRVRRERVLFYSSAMKEQRRQRKRAKTEAAAAPPTGAAKAAAPAAVTVTVDAAAASQDAKEEGDEHGETKVLRIDVAAFAAATPALPVSPCCS